MIWVKIARLAEQVTGTGGQRRKVEQPDIGSPGGFEQTSLAQLSELATDRFDREAKTVGNITAGHRQAQQACVLRGLPDALGHAD